jgi:hypothetical protein
LYKYKAAASVKLNPMLRFIVASAIQRTVSLICTKNDTKFAKWQQQIMPFTEKIALKTPPQKSNQIRELRLLRWQFELKLDQTLKVTSNSQIIRRNVKSWKITRYGHANKGRGSTKINIGLSGSLSRKRLSASPQYIGK